MKLKRDKILLPLFRTFRRSFFSLELVSWRRHKVESPTQTEAESTRLIGILNLYF